MRMRLALASLGAVAVILAFVAAPAAAVSAAEATWPPFGLVTGLLLLGAVANEDGLFALGAGTLARLPGGGLPLFIAAMLLVAGVTAVLNLDTSVAFLTPVLVLVARRRQVGEQRFLYGCVFMSNAASLLLPGSNLTNLLVLAHEHVSGSVFAARMWAPWVAAVTVTTVVVALAFRGSEHLPAEDGRDAGGIKALSSLGVAAAALLMVLVPDAALPVLGIGLGVAAVRVLQRRLRLSALRESVDVVSLAGVLMIAIGLGTLARTWSYPGALMATTNSVSTAVIGAVASVAVNNLPAAVLLGTPLPAHPRSLLLGLNIGPNLAVTGSLSALIWWQAARSVRAQPSARRYSMVGLVLVPLTLGAALMALRVFSPAHL
ncbi:MAG: SLC13 family permease [Candidatus Dormibacteria bacterium]